MRTDLYWDIRGAGPVLLLIPGGNGDAGFYEPFAKAPHTTGAGSAAARSLVLLTTIGCSTSTSTTPAPC